MTNRKKIIFYLLTVLIPLIFFLMILTTLKLRTSGESDYEKEIIKLNEFHVKLSNLPAEIKFPNSLKDRIHYDADKNFLFFKGPMTSQQKDELLHLSQDKLYRDAIDALYTGALHITDLRARAPYVMFQPTPGKGSINSLGFNSPEISKEKKPNEFRIAIVGGSVAFNGELHDSIIAYLAAILKANVPKLKDKEVTFINAGIPSAVTGQELAQLIYHVLPLNIDLLIVFDGYNDFFVPFNYDRRPGYPYDYIVEEYRYYKFKSDKKWWDTFTSLFDTRLLNKQSSAVVHDYYEELGIKKPSIEEGISQTIDIYFRNIQYMATIANAFDVKVAVFLQPYSPKHNKPGISNAEALLKCYDIAGKRFEVLSKENSPKRIYHSMVYMGLTKLKDLFTDIAHIPVEGNRMVAEEMYAVMKKNGMLE
ncbi:MAG: hypothetical protein HQK92_03395 [Nitrospirae bacterium]|nr:hypothetical protein [Nitrospirota bacterium]